MPYAILVDSVSVRSARRESALKCSRGCEQRSFVRRAFDAGDAHSLAYGLRGKAARYQSSYNASFDNLCDRLQAAGLTVSRQLGPRGGIGSATYSID